MKRQALIATLALGAAALAPLAASAQPFDRDWNHHDRGFVQRDGRIAQVDGGSFQLDDGTTVFLNRTAINPTGVRLHRGETVQIDGRFAGNGAINASSVDVIGGFRRY